MSQTFLSPYHKARQNQAVVPEPIPTSPAPKVSSFLPSQTKIDSSTKNNKTNTIRHFLAAGPSKRLILGTVVVLIVILFGLSGLYIARQFRAKHTTLGVRTPAQQTLAKDNQDQNLANKYVKELSQLMTLPNDENPTVAAVTDIESLIAKQPFFKSAKNGDIIIIYPTKAIIYDPLQKRIVDTAPVRIRE